MLQRTIVLLLMVTFYGCSHPLEIRGEGDIQSLSDSRNCALEEQPCANLIIGEYSETYTAVAREGYEFSHWLGCNSLDSSCAFNIAADVVQSFWGDTVDPLVAVFVEAEEPISACPAGYDLWSNPATWGGAVPVNGQAVSIAVDQHIALDTNSANLAGLTIHGSLEFCRQDLALTADWIMLHGELHIGSEEQPFIQQAVVTLTGDDTELSVMGMGNRGLMLMGGVLELHGNPPATAWGKINAHATEGANSLTLAQVMDWSAGDQIVVAPTDYYGMSSTESFEITAIDGLTLTLDQPFQEFHWGLLQYATDTGMSLTPDANFVPPVSPTPGVTPTVLDERAEVGNLTRNIVIQAPDDAVWQNSGFGAHVMVMNLSSTSHIDGVEFRRVGQAGILGRYPFHWHRLSYDDEGNELGHATGHYIRNSAVHNSMNRCITIHATNGAEVTNNVCYNILGHGIFFEDGVERRNVVENNLILQTRNPDPNNLLKLHEGPPQFGFSEGGASSLWVSNPDNTVRGNTGADAQGVGLWLSFAEAPVSSSSNVDMNPSRVEFGNFDNNTMHSNNFQGLMFDLVEIDDNGTLGSIQYVSTNDDGAGPYSGPIYPKMTRVYISGFETWKNGTAGAWSRVFRPDYKEWVSADNEGKYFAGSVGQGALTRSLIIGKSLNDSIAPRVATHPMVGFASYHGELDIHHNVVMNFPLLEGENQSGGFAMDDYYLRPVEMSQVRSIGNRLINSHPGFRSPAPHPTYMTLAGALLDAQGIWGPDNNWFVYDRPLLTHGAICEPVAAGVNSGGISCDGNYAGVTEFILDQGNEPWFDLMAIRATRYDDNNPELAVDVMSLDSAEPHFGLSHMRHFAARYGSTFSLEFPDSTLPSDIAMSIENARYADDRFVLGVQFDGTEPAQVFSSSLRSFTDEHANAPDHQWKTNFAELESKQAVIDSGGHSYWQDTTNNMVWIHVAGSNLEQPTFPYLGELTETSDPVMYYSWQLRIH